MTIDLLSTLRRYTAIQLTFYSASRHLIRHTYSLLVYCRLARHWYPGPHLHRALTSPDPRRLAGAVC